MNTHMNYVIPKGTRVRARNVRNDLRLRQHVTKMDLVFDKISCTGDGATLTYFRRLNWLIVVETEHVVEESANQPMHGQALVKMAG